MSAPTAAKLRRRAGRITREIEQFVLDVERLSQAGAPTDSDPDGSLLILPCWLTIASAALETARRILDGGRK